MYYLDLSFWNCSNIFAIIQQYCKDGPIEILCHGISKTNSDQLENKIKLLKSQMQCVNVEMVQLK